MIEPIKNHCCWLFGKLTAPTTSLSLTNAICAEYFGPISSTTTRTENIWVSAKKHRWVVQFQIGHRHLLDCMRCLPCADSIIVTNGATPREH